MSREQEILDHMTAHPVPWRGRPLARALYGDKVEAEEVTRVMAALNNLHDARRLIRCKVEVPGERDQYEYRIAIATSLPGRARADAFMSRPEKRLAPEATKGSAPDVRVADDATERRSRMKKPRKPRKKRRAPYGSVKAAKERAAAKETRPNGAARWALDQDGDFLFMVEGEVELVVPRAAAAPLIEVVRRHGTVPFAALAAFIQKLDKAEA